MPAWPVPIPFHLQRFIDAQDGVFNQALQG